MASGGPPVPALVEASAQAAHLRDRQATLRVMPMMADLNDNGDIFGGWVLGQIDLAAGVVAGRRAAGRVTTIAVNSVQFKQPVTVGDVVSFYADIVRVGRTSITITVEVYAERRKLANPVVVKVTEATLTFVAIDEQGRGRALPAASDGIH